MWIAMRQLSKIYHQYICIIHWHCSTMNTTNIAMMHPKKRNEILVTNSRICVQIIERKKNMLQTNKLKSIMSRLLTWDIHIHNVAGLNLTEVTNPSVYLTNLFHIKRTYTKSFEHVRTCNRLMTNQMIKAQSSTSHNQPPRSCRLIFSQTTKDLRFQKLVSSLSWTSIYASFFKFVQTK